MSSEYARLRRLVNEELSKLDEYRPNAFMLSHMEEQDQDGDGDEDFDDVRVARYTKGGMSRDKALAKVRRNPMGKKRSKGESASLAESIMRMTLRERRALHESVKRRIHESENAPNPNTVTNLEKLPFDAVIKDRNGNPAFRKTKTGWRVLISIKKQQMLDLVSDASARKELERQIDGTGQGDEVNIPAQLLRDKDLANRGNDLTFKRSGDGFIDAEVISNDKMQEIISAASLEVPAADADAESAKFTQRKQSVPAAGGQEDRKEPKIDVQRFMLGNVKIEIGGVESAKFLTGHYAIKLMVPRDQGFRNFDSLFGEGAEIGSRILANRKKESKKGVPVSINIPIRFATEKSLVRQLATNFFNIGTMPFSLEGDDYVFYDRMSSGQKDGAVAAIKKSAAIEVESF